MILFPGLGKNGLSFFQGLEKNAARLSKPWNRGVFLLASSGHDEGRQPTTGRLRWPDHRIALLLIFFAMSPRLQADEILRVMTFNLRYASATEDQGTWKQWDSPLYTPQRRQFVCRVITNHQPDVIGLQEGEDGQLNYLRTNLPSCYALHQQKPSGGGGHENAAFAWNTNRLDLLDRGVFSLGPSPGGGYWNNPPGAHFEPYVFFPDMGLNCPRLALWGRFRWRATGQEFLFYTTHFDFNEGPQVGSARLITDDARARNDRMPLSPLAVVVGDFNATQAGNAWKLFTGAYTNNGISGDFTDAWWQVNGTWNNSGTLHGFNGGIRPASDRMDWILHRGGFLATQALIVTDSTTATNTSNGSTATMYPSDHYPVLATLRFPTPSADDDGDGLPDAVEFSAGRTRPADPDADGDGLPDAWKQARLDNLEYRGLDDPDRDGAVNSMEWRACTNPTNRSSVFRIEGLERTDTGTVLSLDGGTWKNLEGLSVRRAGNVGRHRWGHGEGVSRRYEFPVGDQPVGSRHGGPHAFSPQQPRHALNGIPHSDSAPLFDADNQL